MTTTEKSDLDALIRDLAKEAFKRIDYAYRYQREGKHHNGCGEITRLVFPQYSDGVTRISEQELRFAFVEAFNGSPVVMAKNYYYSIETPTQCKYKGFSSNPQVAKDGEGRSGEFDMAIYNGKLERICLIEFKANNPGPIEHKKDLLKLKTEGQLKRQGEICRYFIEVLRSYNNGTIPNLKNKVQQENEDNKTVVLCYSLEEGKDLSAELSRANNSLPNEK